MEMQRVNKLLEGEQGSTAIEYSLIGSLIFLAIIASVTAMATEVTALFAQIAAAF